MPLRKMLIKYSRHMGTATKHCDTISGGVMMAATRKIRTMATPRPFFMISGFAMPILARMMVTRGISNTQPKMMNMVRQRLM